MTRDQVKIGGYYKALVEFDFFRPIRIKKIYDNIVVGNVIYNETICIEEHLIDYLVPSTRDEFNAEMKRLVEAIMED